MTIRKQRDIAVAALEKIVNRGAGPLAHRIECRDALAKIAEIEAAALPAGWRDIATAPTDGTFVWVWAAPYDTLPGFIEYTSYHKDAGWCVDELREVTLWRPAQERPDPPTGAVP